MTKKISLTNNYRISQVIKGGWQLAGGHGFVNQDQALKDMYAFFKAGVTTFDCADIYTGVEELIGAFIKKYNCRNQIQIHTKFVPDYDMLSSITPQYVESIIDRSLQRLGIDTIDLVQLHWWDFTIHGYVEAAKTLHALQRKGKIKHIGVTNFDVAHLDELMRAKIPVISNQVQFSVLDRRPLRDMTTFCKKNRIRLLCYGTVAGGFISERYLETPPPQGPAENRSLTKYNLIIEDTGGWEKFQVLLRALKKVGDKHKVSLSTIASNFMLTESQVSAVIVGARNTSHLEDNIKISAIKLTPEDKKEIKKAIENLKSLPGDVYGLERDKHGKHGRIMKYNLNKKV